jgi:hypothetical protein
MTTHNRLAVILLLGTTQTLGWASSFYLPAILADRIALDLGMSSAATVAAVSIAVPVTLHLTTWISAPASRQDPSSYRS